MMQEVEVLKTIQELICSFFSEEQFTLSNQIDCFSLMTFCVIIILINQIIGMLKNSSYKKG